MLVVCSIAVEKTVNKHCGRVAPQARVKPNICELMKVLRDDKIYYDVGRTSVESKIKTYIYKESVRLDSLSTF